MYPKRGISPKLLGVLKLDLGQALQEPLIREKEFWGASKTLNQLASGKYFVDEGQEEATWPEFFNQITGKYCRLNIYSP